ncbi:MAG: YwbE family protein [Bacillota bacterium]|nr:YwbE family protein [Bacillota bacterium]
MNGSIRNDIKIGSKVMIVQKQDQSSGRLTEGIVKKFLTNSPNHPHGIKVMLESGSVGRVKVIL